MEKLRLRQGGDGVIADTRTGHSDLLRDSSLNESLDGIVAKLLQHVGEFIVLWSNMSIGERVQ